MDPLAGSDDSLARWMESYGLFGATTALVLTTVVLAWATAIMATWMRREFHLKTLPRVVPFGRALLAHSGADVTITQKIINTGHCSATIEHVDVHVSLKRSSDQSVPISSDLALPLLLAPGDSSDAAFSLTAQTISTLGGAAGVDFARVIDASIHVRCSGPTRVVQEDRWRVALD